jgi:uncharacterized membrane protein YagU involved in acid resistance
MPDILHAHRLTYRKPDWVAGVWAGLIAGLVFLALEMILVPLLMDGSPWAPPRMIAAIAMGSDVLPPPATFDAGVVAAALAVHFVLAILFGLVLAVIVALFNLDSSAGLIFVVGAVFGLIIYFVNFYGMTAFFPWFADARNWLSLTLHAVFGVVVAESYFGLEKRVSVGV